MRKFSKLTFNKKLKRVYYFTKDLLLASRRKVNDAYHYVRVRTVSPYNVIKVKQVSPDWIDRDQLLPHVIFTVLTEFIEKELGFTLKKEPEQWYKNCKNEYEYVSAERQYKKEYRLWELYKWYWEHYFPWYENPVRYVISIGFPDNKDFIERADGNIYSHNKIVGWRKNTLRYERVLIDEKYKEAADYYDKNWKKIEEKMEKDIIRYMKVVCQLSPFMWT